MAETKTLSQFKSRLAGGGARPNLFEVSIPSFPSAIIQKHGEVVIQEKMVLSNFFVKLLNSLLLTLTHLKFLLEEDNSRSLVIEHSMHGQSESLMMRTSNLEQHSKDGLTRHQ